MSGIMIRCLTLSFGIVLTSWNAPYLSRQKQIPLTYEDQILRQKEVKGERSRLRRKMKSDSKEQDKCAYSAHQKNRLIHFAEREGYIWFYRQANPITSFLSNFYPVPLKIWGMKFYSSEAAFQAAKFLDKPEVAVRFTHLNGEEAWALGKKLSYQRRGDWFQIRENKMLEVLRAKFQQHPELTELLLATGSSYLVMHTSNDTFWADGGDGLGKNRLGNLLMQVRGEQGGTGVVSVPPTYKKFTE